MTIPKNFPLTDRRAIVNIELLHAEKMREYNEMIEAKTPEEHIINLGAYGSSKIMIKKTTFGTDAQERKQCPVFTGCLMYFPNALAAVARLSYRGNQQHHPDKPLHWDRTKSTDELDALTRHLIEGEWDAVAWRALANLEKQIENGWEAEQ